jgi:phthalate 3,4-dioxygenase subunit alpha
MRAAWTPAHQALVGEGRFMVSAATAFPNLSFVHNWPQVRRGGGVVPFVSVRLWQPISATETECCSWFAVAKDAPESFKDESYKAYLMCFGSSGMFEQDDVENWTSITSVAKGRLAGTVELDSTMGMAPGGGTVGSPPECWPAPGSAVVGYGEYNQRAFLALWAAYLAGERAPRSGVPRADTNRAVHEASRL